MMQSLRSAQQPSRCSAHSAVPSPVLALALCLFGALPPSHAVAQEVGPEIGIRGGITRFFDRGLSDGFTQTAFPAVAYPFGTSAYFTFFTNSRVAIEPQVGILHYSSNGEGSTSLTLGVQLMQFARPAPAGAASGYGFIHSGMLAAASEGSSNTSFQLGAGAGYRFVYRHSLGIRVEARYRRWLDENGLGPNELSLGLGFGAVLGGEGQ